MCIETISFNSASLAMTKALSLHLLPAIDLECPPLCGVCSLSVVLNAHLCLFSSSACLILLHLFFASCILAKMFLPACKSFILMWEEVAALLASL